MNPFDAAILHYVNGFAQESWAFDSTINLISENLLLKGGIIMTVFWWLWFRDEKSDKEKSTVTREQVMMTIFSCVAAIFVSRVLSSVLPFRIRPIDNIPFHFIPPFGASPEDMATESSFPSDHAAFIFSLAMGVWLMSRGMGVVSFLYAIFVVSLPRVYLGLHNPTDIITGAFLGILITWVGYSEKIRTTLARPVTVWADKAPALFYTIFFISTYEIASMFWDLRSMGKLAIKIIHHFMA